MSWCLVFQQPDLEHAFWEERGSVMSLFVDKIVWLLNLLVIFSLYSSSSASHDALHTTSLILLLLQATVFMASPALYKQLRPYIMVALRLWRTLLLFQILQPGHIQETPVRSFMRLVLLVSGAVPNCVYAWAYQTSFPIQVVLQLAGTAVAVCNSFVTVQQKLAHPAHAPYVAWVYNALSNLSTILLLPIFAPAVGEPALACPAVVEMPVLLWFQLFFGFVAPVYLVYQIEHHSKTWFWLRYIALHGVEPADVDVYSLVQQVCPGARWSHVLHLLLLAVFTWQICDIAYWLVPWDSFVPGILPLMHKALQALLPSSVL